MSKSFTGTAGWTYDSYIFEHEYIAFTIALWLASELPAAERLHLDAAGDGSCSGVVSHCVTAESESGSEFKMESDAHGRSCRG